MYYAEGLKRGGSWVKVRRTRRGELGRIELDSDQTKAGELIAVGGFQRTLLCEGVLIGGLDCFTTNCFQV